MKSILDQEISPDNRCNGEAGTITQITFGAANDVTVTVEDGLLLEVELDSGELSDLHLRYEDLVLLEDHEQALKTANDD